MTIHPQAFASHFSVKCGEQIDDNAIHSVVVDQDVDQPDMCVLTLNNASHTYSNGVNLGDEVEVKAAGTTIFKGEAVGIEPTYKTGGESRCVIRAFSRLHRLLRGRKSRTFLDQKDSDIATTIAQENGLTATCDATTVSYDHLYQHNQSDLEFLRVRAARIGYEVYVEDKKLYFCKPRADRDSGIEIRLNDPSAPYRFESFTPRLSSAGIVQKVEVRAWDPEKKKEIVAQATAQSSSLGSATGASKTQSPFGEKVTFTVDHPVESQEEAQVLADAKLAELTMDYITGEGLAIGKPDLKPGIVVTIKVRPDGEERFNGKYFIVGATHRYRHAGAEGGPGAGGGYRTSLRVRRDAEGE